MNSKLCRLCKNYYGQRHGGNILICGMHPYGPGDENCDDFEKSDRVRWVVHVLSSEFTSWGVTCFDLSCYNVETGTRVTFSLFDSSEEDAVQSAHRILYGSAEERRNVTAFKVSPPPATPWEWGGVVANADSPTALAIAEGLTAALPTNFTLHYHPTDEGDLFSVAEISTVEQASHHRVNLSSDTAPPTSPEP